ncbi:hypothetical protein FQN60_011681 [Etheostoma spectabile]|uniref:Uncharacterized protein n=1 Tax=Etheostoma spectabile TaxID=54343 RepID=A0A5J5DM86_9PERO|nr:hypothetical protein FQN60_011681 [Etheostoma spectabile]
MQLRTHGLWPDSVKPYPVLPLATSTARIRPCWIEEEGERKARNGMAEHQRQYPHRSTGLETHGPVCQTTAQQPVIRAAWRGHSLKDGLEGPAVQLLVNLVPVEVHGHQTEQVDVHHLTRAHTADHVWQSGYRAEIHWEVDAETKKQERLHMAMATGVRWVKLDKDSSTQSRTIEDWPIGQKLSDDLVHDVLWREEVVQKLGQNPGHHPSFAG